MNTNFFKKKKNTPLSAPIPVNNVYIPLRETDQVALTRNHTDTGDKSKQVIKATWQKDTKQSFNHTIKHNKTKMAKSNPYTYIAEHTTM